jgi:hypothetical protein
MRKLLAVTLLFGIAGSAAAQSAALPPLEARTIELKHLRPDEATNLLKPYIVNAYGSVTSVSPSMPIITIKDIPENIARMEKVLAKYDHSPATIRLVFQLIEADTGPRLVAASNNRVASDLDATLRSVLRFASYRVLGQGMATSGENSEIYQKLATADTVGWVYTYDIRAVLGSIRLSDATLQASSTRRVTSGAEDVDTTATGSVRLSVSLFKKSESDPKQAHTLMETGLDVPLGHTVVLGTAATGKGGVALILTVKPELVRGK